MMPRVEAGLGNSKVPRKVERLLDTMLAGMRIHIGSELYKTWDKMYNVVIIIIVTPPQNMFYCRVGGKVV